MSDETWPFPEPGMAAAMADFPDGPGYVALMPEPVETVPPVVSPELPELTHDNRTACLMAAKRLIDCAWSGDRTQLDCARGYLKDL